MKVFGNTAILIAAVALMGWLMAAQQTYQQSWQSVSTASADDTSLATSMDRAMLALR